MSNPGERSDCWSISEAEIDRVARERDDGSAADAVDRDLRTVWRHSALPVGPDDWEQLSARLADRERAATPRTSRRRAAAFAIPIALAAMLAGLLLSPQLGWQLPGGGDPTPRQVRMDVPAGATAAVTLAEGVEVRIASATTLVYGPARRGPEIEVHLDGEAFFAVAPGAAHSLVVRTSAGDVRDIGTRFNVRARAERVTVAVEEGMVELSAGGERVRVAMGQQSTAQHGNAPIPPVAADLNGHLGWLRGHLSVMDEPIGEVFDEISRRYDVKIHLDESLRGERLTATLRSADLTSTMHTVCSALAASCTPTPEGWVVQAGTPAVIDRPR